MVPHLFVRMSETVTTLVKLKALFHVIMMVIFPSSHKGMQALYQVVCLFVCLLALISFSLWEMGAHTGQTVTCSTF